MPKVKTSELTGPALDWAVGFARCMGATDGKPVLARDLMTRAIKNGMASPSTDWAHGGPLIEREKITVHIGWPDEQPLASIWTVRDKSGFAAFKQRGPTLLIAACRCLVASKLGDVVDIPKELTCSPPK